MNLKFSPQRREGTKIAKETKPSDTSGKPLIFFASFASFAFFAPLR